jgi:hypothetical protein
MSQLMFNARLLLLDCSSEKHCTAWDKVPRVNKVQFVENKFEQCEHNADQSLDTSSHLSPERKKNTTHLSRFRVFLT